MQKVLLEKENSQVAKYGLIVLRTQRVTRRSLRSRLESEGKHTALSGPVSKCPNTIQEACESLPKCKCVLPLCSVHLHRH